MTLIKPVLLFALMSLSTFCSYAQEKKNDVILQLSGAVDSVNITAVSEKEISFTYPNETVTNTINKNLVKEIHFGSGRVQRFSEKIIIRGEDDWEKVMITTLESDVTGLVRRGEVKAKATGTTIFSSMEDVDEKATQRMKREAARMRAHIILIQAQNTKGMSYNRSNAYSLKQGVAYGYE